MVYKNFNSTASGVTPCSTTSGVKHGITALVLLFLILLSPFLVSSVHAETEVRKGAVRLVSPKLIEILPGKIVTCSLLVYNNLESEEEFIEELKIPTTWTTIIPIELPFTLKGRKKQVRIFAFFVPIACSSGKYEIIYSVRNRKDSTLIDSTAFSVEILPVAKLEILVEDKPEIVIAGESYQVKLRLINRGNSRVRIKLEIKQASGYPVRLEPSEVILEAGKSHPLILNVKTDKKLKRKFTHILEINANAENISTKDASFAGRKNGIVTASFKQTISVEIIPRITDEFDPYHRLPVQIKLIGAGEGGKEGYQAEFSGSGCIDEEGKREVGFLFRKNDIIDKGIYGTRDEYWFSYYDKLITFNFGDRGYSLSNLTEKAYYGRGVEVKIHPEKFGFGSFYSKTIWTESKESETGNYVKYQMNKNFNIRGNFLQKFLKDYNDKIYSVQSEITSLGKMALGLEYGFSESDKEGNFRDSAYQIDLRGQLCKYISCSFEKIYAGPKYLGFYNDSDYTTGTVGFPIYHKLRAKFSYNSYKNNLDLNPIKKTSSSSKSYQTGISYSFPFGTFLSFDYNNFLAENYLFPAKYNYVAKTFIFEVGQSFKKFGLRSYLKKGEYEDKLMNTKNDNLEEYSFYTYFQPTCRQSYTFYTRFGDSSFTQDPTKTRNAGITINWNISDTMYFNLNYQKNNFNPEKGEEKDNIFSSFIWTLFNNHSISFRGFCSKYKEIKEAEISSSFVYTVPLGIPVRKKKDAGVLRGMVYDGETHGKRPIRNVVLIAGEATAVTNRKGKFIFPRLKAGSYSLWVEKNSIGLNSVTDEKIPIMIEIKDGQTVEKEIGVVASCSIVGKIIIFSDSSKKSSISQPGRMFLVGSGETITDRDSYEEDIKIIKGLGNILVEITDGKETLQRLSDGNGMFCFEGIRPSKWNLKVDEDNLPVHHYLEKKEFQIELKPGERNETTIKVLPRIRRIKIIERGEIK